uniref:Methylmalonic aciduria and homocystinuria type D protein n=1 Tax=Phaeomonas parva TaxID=124430 RepID=A0A7S1U3I4_9STRA|mmetsp:Transcript_29888/g.95531  ORF Transcript_29888/g.95531 Transcript_29888/m.95531 type:complete len:174 (+) Transcript_29888:333-854(+)
MSGMPLVTPVVIRGNLQISAHECQRSMIRELKSVFPTVDMAGAVAIPTVQHAVTDLVAVGEDVENEKDRLLNVFVDFAKDVVEAFAAGGFWADYIDPCSGLPMGSPGNTVYSEVEGHTRLLHYRAVNAGPCKVLLHPAWGSEIYPATMFTTAPPEVVAEVLQRIIAADTQDEE